MTQSRKPFVGGNWKMNLNRAGSVALAQAVAERLKNAPVDVAICPAFPYLQAVGDVLRQSGSNVKLGAQDVYYEPDGAFTGEVSLAMLKDLGVQVVIIGHSERRHVILENDELINRKVRATLDAGLEVILCVGEKLQQRELGQTDAINWGQLGYGLAGVKPQQMQKVTIAYEPVWAIGTGKTATPQDAQKAHAAIRSFVKFGLFNAEVAEALRIQYGGSCKPGNAAELFAQKDVDGGLIGGAALKAEDFQGILKAAAAGA